MPHSLLPAEKMMGCQPVRNSLEARAGSKNFCFFRWKDCFCVCRCTGPHAREGVTRGRRVGSDVPSQQQCVWDPFPNSSCSSFSPHVFLFFNILVFILGPEVPLPLISSQCWFCSTHPLRDEVFFSSKKLWPLPQARPH